MKLSIIMCVYNTEKRLLSESLSSIVSSTLDDYEIVFVDDGSTLGYSEIVEKYKVKYTKTENRGHFAARLHGIEISEGEYITFVDSDDTVSKNYHLPMVKKADLSGADIVLNGWAFHTDRTKRVTLSSINMAKSFSLDRDAALSLFSSHGGKDHSAFVLWNKIFRRETMLSAIKELRRTSLFSKRLTYAEDVLISFFCYKNASKVVGINSGFYFYRIHSSQSVIAESEAKIRNQVASVGEVLSTVLSHLPETETGKKMREDIKRWQELMSRTHYSMAKYGGFTSLYPFIKEVYGVEKLAMPKLADSESYLKSELLGDNFAEIDLMLEKIFLSEGDLSVSYKKSSVFISRILETAEEISGKKITRKKRGADVTVPSPRVKIRDRVIHNFFVYKFGMLLFKKGSRIRKFLKSHL